MLVRWTNNISEIFNPTAKLVFKAESRWTVWEFAPVSVNADVSV